MDLSNTNWTKEQDIKVNECFAKVLSSPMFVKAERQQRFLSYIMAETLEGRAEKLKGYSIGIEVFDRESTFDPAIDSIVRVEAARLRSKLREYYDDEGQTDSVRFNLPKGSYAIHIEWRDGALVQVHARRADDFPALIEEQPSLAVLPFANIATDSSQDYFADGITDSLISMLSRLSGLFIISKQSSFTYKASKKSAKEIAAELGVRYLLEGSVQYAGNQIRVTAQLIDTQSDGHVWSDSYDRELKDTFALQDELTQSIVSVLQIKLAAADAALFGYKGTSSIEAHDAMLRGIAQFRKYTQQSVHEAFILLTKAAQIDPNYAAVQAWLARVIIFPWVMMWDSQSLALDLSQSHAQRAIELDPQSPYALSILGWVQLWQRESEESISNCRRAVVLDPNNAEAHLFLSLSLASLGMGQEALYYAEKAKRFTPTPAAFYEFALGMSFFVLKEYSKSIAAFEQGCSINPNFIPCQHMQMLAYELMGVADKVEQKFKIISELTGNNKHLPTMTLWNDKALTEQQQKLWEKIYCRYS
jgi:adenylate cyclase